MCRLEYIYSLLLTWAVFTSSHKFPSDIERCKYADSTCISKVVTRILHTYSSKGHMGLNLLRIDPFHVDNMVLEKIPGSPVSIELKFKDIDLIGMGGGIVHNVTGFQKEASDFVFEMKGKYPKIVISGPYSVEGRVLNLPINGQGKAKITFDDVAVTGKAKCTKRVKDGETYLNVVDAKLEIQPKKMTFNFENLFKGNKTMGDNMNRVLNNSWRVVFSTLKPLLEKAFAKVGAYVANGTFSKIPYADLFLPSN